MLALHDRLRHAYEKKAYKKANKIKEEESYGGIHEKDRQEKGR